MARRRIFPVFIPHLGCRHQCVFCDQNRVSGAEKPASGAEVSSALRRARDEGFSGMELAFYGGSFTAVDAAYQEELLSCARPFLADGTLAALRVSTRPDAVDDTVIRRLRRYGVSTVELGAQSMSDEVLRASARGHTARDTENAARLLKAAGFVLILQMMTGLPGADREQDLYTARELCRLRPDGVRVYPTVILEGTALCAMWRRGAYKEHTVADAVALCAELLPVFEAAHIPVLRVGLNPTEELSGGAAVAGAYHPALGELVRSELLFRRASELLRGIPPGREIILGVAPNRISAMIGQRRANIARLTAAFSPASLRVLPLDTTADPDEVTLLSPPPE